MPQSKADHKHRLRRFSYGQKNSSEIKSKTSSLNPHKINTVPSLLYPLPLLHSETQECKEAKRKKDFTGCFQAIVLK